MAERRVGIIGYGDFTRVLIEYLSPHATILVSSRKHNDGDDAGHGARFASVEDVLACQIIIPSIPAQYFRSFFEEHVAQVNPEALVVDVASVKVKPLAVLIDVLPKTCSVLGTHPMFGPASIAKNQGIAGLKCVVCPVRVDHIMTDRVVRFIEEILHLRVIYKTPEQHDKEMAYVQGLSHYIGRVMDEMNIPSSELSTLAYDDLIDMKRIQGGDSWELFRSIMHENPYADEVNRAFHIACEQLDTKLARKG